MRRASQRFILFLSIHIRRAFSSTLVCASRSLLEGGGGGVLSRLVSRHFARLGDTGFLVSKESEISASRGLGRGEVHLGHHLTNPLQERCQLLSVRPQSPSHHTPRF